MSMVHSRTGRSRLTFVAAAAVATPAIAGTSDWANPAGGSWSTPANWSAGVPTSTGDAVFNTGATAPYTVSAVAGYANSVQVQNDDVTLQLGTLNLHPPDNLGGYLTVAADADRSATLTLAGGSLYLSHGASFGGTAGSVAVTIDGTRVSCGYLGSTGLTFGSGTTATFKDGATFDSIDSASLAVNGAATFDASHVNLMSGQFFTVTGSGTTAASAVFRNGSSVTAADVTVGTDGTAGALVFDHSTLSLSDDLAVGVYVSPGRAYVPADSAGNGTVTFADGTSAGISDLLLGGTARTFASGVGTATVTDPGTAVGVGSLAVATLGGTGKLSINNGATVTARGVGVGGAGGQGTVTVAGAGSALNVVGPTTMGGGSLALGSTDGSIGTMNVDAAASVAVQGSVTVYPGSALELGSGGTLAAGATYNQAAGAALTFTLAAGGGGLLSTTGTAVLGGTLDVSLGGGFVPSPGESFQLLSFASETGRFSAVNLPPLPIGESWDATGLYTTGRITAVPEPAGVTALAAVLIGRLTGRRRRARGRSPADAR